MYLDGHIHMRKGIGKGAGAALMESLKNAGMDGGMILSESPERPARPADAGVNGIAGGAAGGSGDTGVVADDYKGRLDRLLEFCGASETLFPCFWIDPVSGDAVKQVEYAARHVVAFKTICSAHYPGDERAMDAYSAIAAAGKPILFHSGILWDGRPSSKYNMPHQFECMLDVPGIRFALAHISWPWCDECIAVLGKCMNALVGRPELKVEMFVDTTPGTPVRWRRDALEKLLCGDYDVLHNVMFGSDCSAANYNTEWTKSWLERDRGILKELFADDGERAAYDRQIFGGNLLRFLGKSGGPVDKRLPQVAV